MRLLPRLLFLLISSVHLSLHVSVAAATSRPTPTIATADASSSPLSILLPAVSAAVRDLSAVDPDDVGFLTVAKRNMRFMLGTMVSPLQLLDWSHLSPRTLYEPPSDYKASEGEERSRQQGGQGRGAVVAGWDDGAEEDIDFAEHGDPTHMVRVAVNAHKQRASRSPPNRNDDSDISSVPAVTESVNAAVSSTGAYQPVQSRMHVMDRPPIVTAALEEDSDDDLHGSMYAAFESSTGGAEPLASTALPPNPVIDASSSAYSSTGAYSYSSLSSLSSSSSSSSGPDDCNEFVSCGRGKPVNFTKWDSNNTRICTRQLCVCPYDYTTRRCEYPYLFTCRPRYMADPDQHCQAAANLPRPTAYSSHSDERANTHLAASDSDFFTYEAILSGPPPPCVTVDNRATELAFNFTCWFWTDSAEETWGDWWYWNQTVMEDGYVQNGMLPQFGYYVLNQDVETNRTVFAMSLPYDPIALGIRVHNTAHPSQSNYTSILLTTANLQWTNITTATLNGTAAGSDAPTTPISTPFSLREVPHNMRRGGRVLLGLTWAQKPWGLDMRSSGMPWQLTLEDATWALPPPARRVLLTRWQAVGVVVLVLVVVALCVWRWYQRRQTAKMQALLTEQRGRQQSWFESTN